MCELNHVARVHGQRVAVSKDYLGVADYISGVKGVDGQQSGL